MTDRRRNSILILLLVVLTFALLPAGCGGSEVTVTTAAGGSAATSSSATSASPDTAATSASRTFTPAELAEFDGKDGQPAYVAVDGIVYDVSDSSRWPDGTHSSCNLGASAGQDLSEVIKQAPANMRSLLEQMPVVGTLVD
jgi:predicted heme/steroid binding protein